MSGSAETFSLTMIVRDEEENLHHSLAPVAGSFDEIIVVDTGSVDGTVKLAQSLGAKVVKIGRLDHVAGRRQSYNP